MTTERLRRLLPVRAPRSARVRILAWVVGLCALALTGAGTAFYLVERALVAQNIAEDLEQEIAEFDAYAKDGIDPETGAAFTSADRLLEAALGRTVPAEHQALLAFVAGRPAYVQGVDGDALAASAEFAARVNALPRGGSGSVQVAGGTVRFAVKAVQAPDQRGSYVVAAFSDREHAELRQALEVYALVALVALAAVALGAWSVAGRVLRPLRDLQVTADRITHSDLTGRIAVAGTDDIADLARTFNDMLDRLEESFAGQRRFLDDAGHELRTPITIVRGHLELLDSGDAADVAATRELVLDELDRMSRLVDDLVDLARAQRPDFLRLRVVQVGSLVDDVLDKARALGDRAWRSDGRAEIELPADPQRLQQALLALADNAVRHTDPGGVVAIGSAVAPGRVSLWVRDEGIGVAEADAERIFERFERGPRPSHEGSGLGLSIVQAIAVAHCGGVRVESAPGAGARFVIELPAPLHGVPFPPVAHAAREESRA